MRAALVFLTFALTLIGNASAFRISRRPRSSIWSNIRRNAADVRKLTRAVNKTQQFEQAIGPVVKTLKENVDNMKEGFVSQTKLMAQMKTSINDMKGNIEHLQKATSEPEEYNCQEDGVVYMHRKFPDAPVGALERDGKTDTWQECQKRCAEIEQCKGFTWHKESSQYTKYCSLFSSHSGKITGGRTVSGLKECPMD